MRFVLFASALFALSAFAVDESALDRTVNPCDDFYSFACGGWVKSFKLPPGYSSWTRSFDGIEKDNLETLKTILEGYAAGSDKPKVTYGKKLGDYYSACLDEASAETATTQLLPTELSIIDRVQTLSELSEVLAQLQLRGVSAFFEFGSDRDYGDAKKQIAVFDRGGMGLPDKDYYLSTDAGQVALRVKYLAHITKTLALSGYAAADEGARTVLKIETALAEHALSLVERRDPAKIYHPSDVTTLRALVPWFDWDAYLSATGAPAVGRINVTEPDYFKALGEQFRLLSAADIRVYLRWQYLRMASPKLGKALAGESFDFYGRTLAGQKEQAPRWKRCIDATTATIGEALGEAYVKLKFSEGSKTEALTLIENIHKSVLENFDHVEWMDAATREQAKKKLGLIFKKIGYPDKWKDYSTLALDRVSYFSNTLKANAFATRANLAKIGKPVDKTEWQMTPQTVNAYYEPTLNEIVFPTAILQLPFYDVKSPLAWNYGGIGMVMGHETTHAFDDEGRNFDGEGNLKNWWTKESEAAFTERAACLVKQYDGYTVADGVHLDGKLKLGENIADLGGIKLSFAAFQAAKHGAPAPDVAGFNEDQQFFVSFAQGWCATGTPEWEKLHAKTNPHSHPRYRVNGVVVNVPEFGKAFGCKVGAPMNPEKRCVIW